MTGKLEGTVALVTGASSGIGEATAIALADQGASLAIAARRRDRLEALVERVGSATRVQVHETDVTDEGQVNEMVAARLLESDTARGYILDGFPRTLGQANWLDDRLAAQIESLPVVAVDIQVNYNELLRRITGRRNCPVCQTIYNVFMNPPKKDGFCDVEGAALTQRADDTEEVYKERMRAYTTLTAPVVDHYRDLGRFAEVDGDRPIAAIAAGIVAAVERLRHAA